MPLRSLSISHEDCMITHATAMLLFFSTVTLLLCDVALTESTEAAILISTLGDAEVVNASSTVDLLCLAYGSTLAPSIEWMSFTNGKTAIINNSTYSQRYTICEQKIYTFTESILRIEDIQLEDEGLYSCATRLENGEVSVSANKAITVLSNESNEVKWPGAATGGILALLLLTGALVIILWYCGRQQRKKYYSRILMRNKRLVDEFILSNKASEMDARPNSSHVEGASTTNTEANIKTLLVCKTDIHVMNIIGAGEYSQVYRAKLQKPKTHYFESVDTKDTAEQTTEVAVKMLTGSFNDDDTKNMIRECVLIHNFDHPNVISLIGLCLDAGPSPYIILPFMENGSLLSYVKNNRAILLTNTDTDEEMVCIAQKKLMDMCLQISKGMEYLANMKLVHRDLAARNCMIDEHWIIKVADFGLSEVLTASKDYFREKEDTTCKLPVKWMAPESLLEGVFSEKSDVWSYGVTCWEIFTTGIVPYPGVHPMILARELSNGLRLYKPDNTACSDQMYALMNSCWKEDPKLRPGFSELVKRISKDLQGMTNYLYVGAFNLQHTTNTE